MSQPGQSPTRDMRVQITHPDRFWLAARKDLLWARAAAKNVADAEANIATRFKYRCGGYGGRDYKSYKEV